jgi:predicted AlkP superfamily phosphohydrolase/phosphomutase
MFTSKYIIFFNEAPKSQTESGAKPNEVKHNLIPIEQALMKMSPEEKSKYEQLQQDYVKALDLLKPILREISKKREGMLNDILVIKDGFNYNMGATASSVLIAQPWLLVPATLGNLVTIVDGIRVKINSASIDELETYSYVLDQKCNDMRKAFYKHITEMRQKYTNEVG